MSGLQKYQTTFSPKMKQTTAATAKPIRPEDHARAQLLQVLADGHPVVVGVERCLEPLEAGEGPDLAA